MTVREGSFAALDLEYTSRDTRLPLELGLIEVDVSEIAPRHTFWFRIVGHPWPHVTGTHDDNSASVDRS